jgi:hypothetical protein
MDTFTHNSEVIESVARLRAYERQAILRQAAEDWEIVFGPRPQPKPAPSQWQRSAEEQAEIDNCPF